MISSDSAMNQMVFSALSACLSVSGTAADRLIQKAYADPENPGSPPRERDVVYYWLDQDDSSGDGLQAQLPAVTYSRGGQTAAQNRETALISDESAFETYSPRSASSDSVRALSIRSFLAYRLHVICYGDRSEEYAHRIRSMLYLDEAGKPRAILRAAGIYPIPNPPEPLLLHEEANSLWRKRADLTISLRVTDELSASQPAVTVKPETILYAK